MMSQLRNVRALSDQQSQLQSSRQLLLPKVSQASLGVGEIDAMGLARKYTHPGEVEVLVALMRSVGAQRVVEIGVNEGRTAKAVLRNIPTIEKYLGVDVTPGTYYHFKCKVQQGELPQNPGHIASDDPRFELLLRPQGTKELQVRDFGHGLESVYDVVFIDGDHSYLAVHHDTCLAEMVLRSGGIIIWHDYHGLKTVDVQDFLEDRYREGHDIKHVENTWIAFEVYH